MNPAIGEICKFIFINKFTSLDGIYKVESINSLDELLVQKVDIFDVIYAPLTIDDAEYQTDVALFKTDQIFKLKGVVTGDIIYIPESFNQYVPDPNVFKYLKLGFAVDIGIFQDQATIEWIQSQIGQALQAVAGIEKEPTLFAIDSVYMTEAEYATIDDARQVLISDVTNHYTDKEALALENTRLKTIVAEYEATIKILNTP